MRHALATHRSRRGVTLIELVLAITILLIVTAALAPSLSTALMLDQRQAARKIALAYERLQSEAVLRNKTYRIAFDLRNNSWTVEQGDAGATIFSDPESREDYEERVQEQVDNLTPEELRQWRNRHGFSATSDAEIGAQAHPLPEGIRFQSIFTPQYAEPVTLDDIEDEVRRDKDDDSPTHLVYSYVFANGFAEHTVVQIVHEDDDEDGFTITVDPVSGRVRLHAELIDQRDAFDFLPDEGPKLEL